ncbi:MAG: carbohydrate binding family 9 domain-containing protein [Fidelibacterota bacterium]|nr:MAG: carbohydrate binding family 9 domain-containing protein [Candidatus Neomarinimicrobiota bacterium]
MRRRSIISPRLSTLLILCLFPTFAALAASGADENRATPLKLSRLSDSITLDGPSDEPAWQVIEPLPLVMHVPTFEGAMTERTEIRVAYDDDYLYLAGRMYDSNPSGIQAVDIVRDAANFQNDWFGVILDSFNDNENALAFFTNPAGIRTDFSVSNDMQSMYDFNNSWSTFWDAAVQRNDQGWFAELRIPFSSLRFQDEHGAVIMGLSVSRRIARKGESHVFPAIPPNWEPVSTWKPSQAQRVRFTGVYSRNPLYVTPYAMGGLDQAAALNPAGTNYETDNTPARDLGLDVKYGLTSNLTLDLTLNTDFAQVEADDQQINLTRFSLFFPEKRLFFQERASTFEFGLGEYNRLFHSRRIGIYKGDQVPIYGGARLVGRVGNWDVGAIDMQTAPLLDEDGQTTLSSENLGVARLRRQVFNPYSYVGGMVTSRVGSEGGYNYAGGLDGILRLFGEDYLAASWAQTIDSGWEEAPSVLDAGQLRLNWQRRSIKGMVYGAEITRRGNRFQPGLGFVDRTDITLLQGQVGYGWFSPESSLILRQLPSIWWTEYRSTSTGQVESVEAELNWYIETKKDAAARFVLYSYFEHLADSLKLRSLAPDAYVPTGDYRFTQVYAYYSLPSGNLLGGTGWVRGGEYYDGWQLTARISPRWKSSRFIEVGGSARLDYVAFPKRDQEYVNSIVQLRVKSSLSVTTSVAGFIQYNSAIDAVIVNLRLRYNPREGTDLYLVYNDNLNTDRQREVPTLPFSDTRAVLLKYSITFLR